MKKITILCMLLVITFVGCGQQKEEKEVYIEFVANKIYLYVGEEIDLLGDRVIKDSNGEITYSPELNVDWPGGKTITYTVTGKGNPSNTKSYEVVFVVQEEEQINEMVDGYPTIELGFSTSEWLTKDFDSRIVLPNPETGEDSDYMELTLNSVETKRIVIIPAATEMEATVGTYTYLGEGAYQFEVSIVFPPEYVEDVEPKGPYKGYFVIADEKLYYMGKNNDFDNYENYPSMRMRK